ncbi:hypothetical protein like AT5G53840 [Hibiscus trionum]|uniref:F-box domain-containing protein n=1 Tax=Hibiscus trionum TaxID=183268 RepID=A0A9W7GQ64_HIBTR|nr:hypothetical protein like AT5G53840 [Hibiscus trionum]
MASNTGKKAKHDDDDDRISKLPDSILSHILSLLPIKDAVSTSTLSTRWQHLFASMFILDVDFHSFRLCPLHTVKSFINFMGKLFFLHTEGRIEQFRLNYIDIAGIDASFVCKWIFAALWRRVKEIDLVFTPQSSYFPMLPTALLFTGRTLVRLKLEFPYVMTVPTHAYLPSLKALELQSIKFEDDDSVKRLLTSCPVLEDLSISHCYMGNMKCLQISNPSLKVLNRMKTWKRMGLFKFLQFSPNLQTLVISNVSNEITFPMEKVPSCVAYQLKEFKVLDFDDESSLFKMVTYILKNAKVLNKLTICTTRLLEAEEKFRITKQLLSLPRCSNKCQLIAF